MSAHALLSSVSCFRSRVREKGDGRRRRVLGVHDADSEEASECGDGGGRGVEESKRESGREHDEAREGDVLLAD